MIAWLLDAVPWWLWAIGVFLVALVSFSFWHPLWLLLPNTARVALVAVGAGILAYLAGRNRGADGAVERERQRNEQAAGKLEAQAAAARQRQRAVDAGGVPVDAPDPFRRD